METSKTPLTDAAETPSNLAWEFEKGNIVNWPVVKADFARDLETKLLESQAQVLMLREALEKLLKSRPGISDERNVAIAAAECALTSPPPAVIALSEHEKLLKAANEDADRLAEVCKIFVSPWVGFQRCTSAMEEALAAHEARKEQV